MSDTEMPAAATADAGEKSGNGAAFEGMPQADVDFIMACIKNAMEGVLTVDAQKIADALGYTNLRSVGNRVGAIRKKYGLAISVSAKGGKSEGGATKAATTPKTPRTPKAPKVAADKVTKTPASRGKKAATKKDVTTPEPESADAEEDEDEEMADAEPVKTPVKAKKAAAPKKETPAKKAATPKKAAAPKKETPAKKAATPKKATAATPKKSASKVEDSDSEDMMVDADEELEDLAVKDAGDSIVVEQEVIVEDAGKV